MWRFHQASLTNGLQGGCLKGPNLVQHPVVSLDIWAIMVVPVCLVFTRHPLPVGCWHLMIVPFSTPRGIWTRRPKCFLGFGVFATLPSPIKPQGVSSFADTQNVMRWHPHCVRCTVQQCVLQPTHPAAKISASDGTSFSTAPLLIKEELERTKTTVPEDMFLGVLVVRGLFYWTLHEKP